MLNQHRLFSASYLVQLAIVLVFASIARAEIGQSARYPIAVTSIADLLNRSGLHVQPSQVHLPVTLTARSSSPELGVISIQVLGKNEMLIGLRCKVAGDCLPFNATVFISNSDAASAVLKGNLAALHEQPNRSISFRGSQAPKQAKVMIGTHVTLVIRDGPMEIHLPVVAMDSGSAGAQVRVQTADPRKTFRGVVVDAQTVTGAAQ